MRAGSSLYSFISFELCSKFPIIKGYLRYKQTRKQQILRKNTCKQKDTNIRVVAYVEGNKNGEWGQKGMSKAIPLLGIYLKKMKSGS